MSRGVIGVACIAWKTLVHTRPPMIGKVASNDALCIAGGGQQARRQEHQIRHATECRRVRHVAAKAQPIAVRNRAGDRNDEKIDARKVRRYWRNRCSKTRPMGLVVGCARTVIGRDLVDEASGRSAAGRRPPATTAGRGRSQA